MANDLDRLLDAARQRQMSPEEDEAQRVSFVYGNAPEEDRGSKDTVRAASTFMKKVTEEK